MTAKNNTTLTARGMSDKGVTPDKIRDALLVNETDGIFIVTDGIGVHYGSGTAAEMAIGVLPMMLEPLLQQASDMTGLHNAIRTAIHKTNEHILGKMILEQDLRGAGATLVLAVVKDGAAHLTHLGDSRAYFISDGNIFPVTKDHTLANTREEEANPQPGQAPETSNPEYISRFLGKRFRKQINVEMLPLAPGDKLLLCTAGLHKMLPDREILDIMQNSTSDNTCQALIKAANKAGGEDNITALLIEYGAA